MLFFPLQLITKIRFLWSATSNGGIVNCCLITVYQKSWSIHYYNGTVHFSTFVYDPFFSNSTKLKSAILETALGVLNGDHLLPN